MPEVNVSGMSPEERMVFAANAISKMPIGKAAVGLVDMSDGSQRITIVQRSSETEFCSIVLTIKDAFELQSFLGTLLEAG